MPLGSGIRLGAYEILSAIGAGGMGEVYRARDAELDRLVAIKVLPETLALDARRLNRFEQEARLASSLNHPNIVTIYTIGREGSIRYIAMELVDGDTLYALMAGGRLPLPRIADVAAQIASGLAKAHDAGIVHRDLKPQNVMVTKDGLVKILDFGLGMLTPRDPEGASMLTTVEQRTPLTVSGEMLGTASYMSPEQASLRSVDFRSDQFSVGSMLYEMVTGRRAFSRPTSVQTMAAIIEDAIEPLTAGRGDVPELLQRVVERCLTKDPAARYASTHDLAHDLQTLREQLARPRIGAEAIASRARISRPRAWLVFALSLALLLLAGAWLTPGIQRRVATWRSGQLSAGRQQLAVVPFANVGNDSASQPFTDGLVEILTNQLTQIAQPLGALDVVPATDVRREGLASVRDARRIFGVSRVITGSVLRTATRVRVTVNLVDAETLRQVSARSIDLELQDVAAMQDGVVREVAALLGSPLDPETTRTLNTGGTTVPAAYDAYIQARGHLQRYEKLENVEAAIIAFRHAVSQDPRFALAHAGLGEAYWRKYEGTKDRQWAVAARSSCTTALGLAEGLAPVYVTLGLIDAGTGGYENAVDELKHAISLDPLSSDAYRELANAYQALNKTDAAEVTYKRAVQIRPNYWANYSALGRLYFRLSRYADAEAQYRRVIALTPDNANGYSSLGAIYYLTKRYDEAAKMFQQSIAVQPNYAAFSNLGTLYFSQGHYADAARTLERALAFNDRESQLWSNLASAYYWVPGEREKARAAYEQALARAEQESRVNPRNATLLMRMADCYSRLGDPDRARQLIDRALALASADVNLMSKAGTVYEQIGDRARALQWINKAVALGFSRDLLERSPDLAALRADPRFTKR